MQQSKTSRCPCFAGLSTTLFIVFGCTIAVVLIALTAILVVFLLRIRRPRRPPTLTETLSGSEVTSYDRPLSGKSRLWFDESESTRSLGRSGSDLTSYEQQRAEVIKDAVAKEPAVVRFHFKAYSFTLLASSRLCHVRVIYNNKSKT